MPEEKTTETNTTTPEQDIVEGLFDEKKEDIETTTTETTTKEKTTEDATTTEGEKKEDVRAIIREEFSNLVNSQIKPLLNKTSSSVSRQQQLNNWFNSEDGKIFIQYRSFIEKAAEDPRFGALSVKQLPGAILKQSAYAKVLSDYKAKADREAADSTAGGTGGTRSRIEEDGKQPDFKNMTRKEFAEFEAENKKKMKRR